MVDLSNLIPADMQDIQEGKVLYSINPYHPNCISKHVVSYKHISTPEIEKLHPYIKPSNKFMTAYVQMFMEYLEEGRLFKEKPKPKKHGKKLDIGTGTLKIGLQAGWKRGRKDHKPEPQP